MNSRESKGLGGRKGDNNYFFLVIFSFLLIGQEARVDNAKQKRKNTSLVAIYWSEQSACDQRSKLR